MAERTHFIVLETRDKYREASPSIVDLFFNGHGHDFRQTLPYGSVRHFQKAIKV